MNVEFCRGKKADRQDILDFADLVFSKSHCPHDFKTLLPKLYGEQAEFEPLHYLVKEDGKIRAMICVLPMEYQVEGQILKGTGIGTVSVHPAARSKGYMKKLMQWALEDMEKEGYAFGVLGGLRQRYEYFGYTPAGGKMQYFLNRDNLRHRYRERCFKALTVRPMETQDVEKCYSLFLQRPVHAQRTKETFLVTLQSWKAQPYVIEHEGHLEGYFVLGGNHLSELVLTQESLLPDLLHAIFDTLKVDHLQITLPLWETQVTPELGHLCEGIQIISDHNYRIMDYAAMVRAFLQIKSGYTPLPNGTLTLAIRGRQTIRISVRDNVPSVEEVSEQTPDFTLEPLLATRLLFTPQGWREIPEAGMNLLVRSWFPLPLYLPDPDNC